MKSGFTQARKPRRPIPPGLLGMIGLVVMFECLVASRAVGIARCSALSARFAAGRAIGEAKTNAVIGLGDSVMKFGFDPAEVRRVTGLSAYNLAVPGGPPPLADALLKRLLDAGGRPSVVVIGHLSLSGDPRENIPEFAEVLDTVDCLRLAVDTGDPGLFAALTLARLLPTVRYQDTLRAIGRQKLLGLKGNTGVGGGAAKASLRHWSAGLGCDRRTRTTKPGVTPRETRMYEHPWVVVPAYERSLQRLAARAEANGIQVFWLLPPLAPHAQERREALGLETPHTIGLRVVHDRLPGVVVLDARGSGFPASDFWDACHLNDRGAGRLSAGIATAIAPRLGRPDSTAWVALTADDHPRRIATGEAPAVVR